MNLVEILVPANGAEQELRRLRDELTERFGGVTIFSRSPAVGLWKENAAAAPERDDIIVFEVMTEELDRSWWHDYRETLESRFGEDLIVMRSTLIEQL